MNSFDLYSQERILNSFNDNIISRDNLIFSEIKSTREKNPNNIISSPIIQAQNILKLNNSNDNIKNNSLNSFLYKSIQNSPSENYSNIEYDNKINELKEKLRALKEHNKISINNINLMKLKINKLQSEEKASIRELENTQQRILKINSNRQKNFFKNNINPKKKININLISIKNKNLTLNNTSNNSKTNIYFEHDNKSQNLLKIKNNLNNSINDHNSFRINFNYKNYSLNNSGLTSPKINYFINKNGINNSYELIQTQTEPNYNNNNKKKIRSNIFNKKMKNKNNNLNDVKIDIKTQIKKSIIKKLEEHEQKKREIEEEIKKIEKEEYELMINFNKSINGENTSNTNTLNDKKMEMFENQEENEYEEEMEYNFILYFYIIL